MRGNLADYPWFADSSPSLLACSSMQFQERKKRVRKQRHRMEHNLFKKYNIIVDSRIHGRHEWHSALHIDPELQRSLRRPPVHDQAPERTIAFRDPTTHDPELHDYGWLPPRENGQCFGTYSNPTPASGLTDHTRKKFMDHLDYVIGLISGEYDQLEAEPHLSNDKEVLKARLGADLYQLKKQYVRLKVGGDVDPHELKEHL
jgi:hypothetical protein